MKVKNIDWQFVTHDKGYTSETWQAEVPGGMLVRHDVIKGAVKEVINDYMENKKTVPLDAWGKVIASSMVFIPSPRPQIGGHA